MTDDDILSELFRPQSVVVDDICKRLLENVPIQSWYEDKFASLKTNLDRVNFVYGDMKKYDMFPKLIPDGKNDSESEKFREKGNKLFALGKYLSALEMYTVSIAKAQTDNIRALAYANRSNCLYKLKLYTECVADIDRAFANNYTGEKKQQLISRRRTANTLQKPVINNYEEIPEIPERNPMIQCASSSVKIDENQQFGRFVVATRTIEIGEIVSVEKPFASVLRSDFNIHCHHCLKLCYNLIPCNQCTKALYCTEECLEEARNTYHKYECIVLPTVLKLGIGWILIALKVAFLARGDYHHLDTLKLNKNEQYRSDRYKELHNLTTKVIGHFDRKLFVLTVASAILCELLKTTDFFEDEKCEDAFKEVLLFQIQAASVNGVNIYEYAPAPDGVCYEGSDFAGGMFSFSSLYNHSCCRNLFRSYHGSTLVVRAINTIKKGQQCFINYGAHYDIASLFARRIMLNRNFDFDCKCKACEEDWEANFVTFYQAMGLTPGSREGAFLHSKMALAEVEFVKKFLPRFIAKLKRCEEQEPWGEALTLKRMIGHCFETLGNKRRM